MTWWLPIFLSSFLVSQLRVPCVHAWSCPKKLAKSYYPNWLATSHIWYTNGTNSGPCWICGFDPFLQQSWNLDAFTPKFSTMHAALVPLGLAQIDPGLAGICFAMQNPRPRMACHCMSQVFSWLLCAWQWHLLEFWRLHCDIVVQLVLLAVLGILSGLTWMLHTLVPHGLLPAAGSRLGDSKL